MAARDFGEVRRDFDAVMLANLSQQRLAAAWQLMTADLGAFEHADEPIHKDVGGTTVWFVPMVFAQGSFEVQVTFDAQGLVAGLYLRRARFDATL